MIGQVFEAEKQVTKTGVIHKYCLACNDCNCNLDASSFFNGGDGEVIFDIELMMKHTFILCAFQSKQVACVAISTRSSL